MTLKSAKQTWVLCFLVAGAFIAALPAASANADEWSYEGYRYYTPRAEDVALGRAYAIDPVNRRSSLTPEPVWRGMFPSIHERMMIEHRVFGTAGQVDREYRFWRRYR